MESPVFFVIALIAIGVNVFWIFLALFQPPLRYKISSPPEGALDSKEYLGTLEALADAQIHGATSVEVFTNGEHFYEAELADIRKARHSVNLEAYIFQKGEVTQRFVEALAERARAGVKVNMVLDAIGSFGTFDSYFRDLIEAGGRVAWYHPFRWDTLMRLNHRTHREIIVIDGKVGFLGGAGFGDHWLNGTKKKPRWRDTMIRMEGEAVNSLQAVFAENWVESCGELIMGREYFPLSRTEGHPAVMVVNSSPSAGLSTRARMLFQTLLASAQDHIYITSPYFLPDGSMREELIRAVKERGVTVKVIVPGKKADHLLTRRSSRRLYGELLKSGIQIYEYQPSMLHHKCLIVDGVWSVTGSTNFDHRSFGINDEVNLAACDTGLAARLEEDFVRDLASSRFIRYEEWSRRPVWEKAHEWFGWLLERQQ